jgi:lipoate-protein ligase A
MKWCDVTFDTPAENLACDEALLDLCEREGVETLRFWESRQPFVVVGYGNRVASEVNVEACERRGIPILRRCSGGGTVVQGPGCLNYNLTLRIQEGGPRATVTGTNRFVMERNREALETLLCVDVSIQGHTDLAFSAPRPPAPNHNHNRPPSEAEIRNRITIKITKEGGEKVWFKFSGNAQRRRKDAFVFHGTILYAFDLSLIHGLLGFPSKQPEYRAGRPHGQFVANLPMAPDVLKQSLRTAWNAEATLQDLPSIEIERLVQDHYSRVEWNFRC